MNRNVESHFAQIPTENMARSVMKRSHSHTTSFNVGDLIPIYLDATIMPGDTVQIKTSKIVRLQTMLTPVLGNIYLDTYFFFVPYRLVYDDFKAFMGENTHSPWIDVYNHTIPTIASPSGGYAVGTIADHFGYPVGIEWTNLMGNAPSCLPFRAYAMICDQFFRDENNSYPLNIPTNASNMTGSNGSDYINDTAKGGMPFKVAKYHDFYTSMLPGPQKHGDVKFPLLGRNIAPVGARGENNTLVSGAGGSNWKYPIHFKDYETTPYGSAGYHNMIYGTNGAGSGDMHTNDTALSGTVNYHHITPTNLWADLSDSIGMVTINQMRLAFQLQKYYEKLARGGSRYTEIIKQMFNVTSPDARLQRPEYLGGNRVPINVHEVLNTAQTNSDFLGDLGAMSRTVDSHYDFQKSFTEHGMLIGVCAVRYKHSYSQMMDPMLLRKTREEWYMPVFAHIGEQPYRKCTICFDDSTKNSDDVFGYQEAWADYRYMPDRVTGLMRPGVTGSLASWNLSDYYTTAPTLSDTWIREDKGMVDRTLAVTSSVSDQVFADFYFDATYTRVMPVYSVPGLVDHF